MNGTPPRPATSRNVCGAHQHKAPDPVAGSGATKCHGRPCRARGRHCPRRRV